MTLQLGNPQLLVRDHGQVGGRLGSGNREFGRSNVTLSLHVPRLGALDHERRFQSVDIVQQGCKVCIHAAD